MHWNINNEWSSNQRHPRTISRLVVHVTFKHSFTLESKQRRLENTWTIQTTRTNNRIQHDEIQFQNTTFQRPEQPPTCELYHFRNGFDSNHRTSKHWSDPSPHAATIKFRSCDIEKPPWHEDAHLLVTLFSWLLHIGIPLYEHSKCIRIFRATKSASTIHRVSFRVMYMSPLIDSIPFSFKSRCKFFGFLFAVTQRKWVPFGAKSQATTGYPFAGRFISNDTV